MLAIAPGHEGGYRRLNNTGMPNRAVIDDGGMPLEGIPPYVLQLQLQLLS